MTTNATRRIIVATSGWFFFLSIAEAQPAVHYWDLSTGSHIAHADFSARDSLSATPLIFLHGGPGGYEVSAATENHRSDRYRKLANLGFNVYLYDQIGGGLSERLDNPWEYTVDRHVRDLEAIRVLVGNKPSILIAGSWGATLACHYLAKYPANFIKVIFVSPKNIDYCELVDKRETFASPADLLASDLQKIQRRFDENTFKRYEKLVNLMRRDIRQAHAFAGDSEMDRLNDSIWAPMMKHYVYSRKMSDNSSPSGMGWWSFIMTSWDALMLKPVKEQLRLNHTPVLVIRGESDIIPEETAREYISVFPNAKWITVPRSGHLIGLERPDLLENAIIQFLEDSTESTTHHTGNDNGGK